MSKLCNYSYDADGFVIYSQHGYEGLHRLHVAIYSNEITETRKVLEQGVDPNMMEQSTGKTGLHFAVQRARDGAGKVSSTPSDMIKLLLEYKASTNVTDVKGSQPLYFLAPTLDDRTDGSLIVLDLLLESKADINHKNNNKETLLSQCCTWSDRGLAEELLERGADPRDDVALEAAHTMLVTGSGIFELLQMRIKLTETDL